MPQESNSPSRWYTRARLALNADLRDLELTLDALAGQVARLAKRIPSEYADPDFNDVIVEDLTRLRLNLREASAAISPFVIPIKKASALEKAEEAGQ